MSNRLYPLWPMALLAVLAVLGLAVQALDLVDARALLDWARGLTAHWWFVLLLVLLQVVLFTFALPGSAVLWLVAPLFAPAAVDRGPDDHHRSDGGRGPEEGRAGDAGRWWHGRHGRHGFLSPAHLASR